MVRLEFSFSCLHPAAVFNHMLHSVLPHRMHLFRGGTCTGEKPMLCGKEENFQPGIPQNGLPSRALDIEVRLISRIWKSQQKNKGVLHGATHCSPSFHMLCTSELQTLVLCHLNEDCYLKQKSIIINSMAKHLWRLWEKTCLHVSKAFGVGLRCRMQALTFSYPVCKHLCELMSHLLHSLQLVIPLDSCDWTEPRWNSLAWK